MEVPTRGRGRVRAGNNATVGGGLVPRRHTLRARSGRRPHSRPTRTKPGGNPDLRPRPGAAVWTFAAVLLAGAAGAQETVHNAEAVEGDSATEESTASSAPIEEVVVLGRLINSTRQLINERQDDEVVSDVMGSAMIGRLGDTTVAVALRRIPGLSLVNEKFIYVRGLGERYSSTLLNGATIPSPDLTRNVIPLDIFPTSIVSSLRVQKAYSADMPAAFGGGAVDIRTKGIPGGFTYAIEVGAGYNFENDGDAYSYPGGGDDRWGTDDGSRALSPQLESQIARFLGNLDVQGILDKLRKEGNHDATVEDARRINRELALHLNRDVSVEEQSIHPDLDLKASIGNNVMLGNDWELGFLFGAGYKTTWRENERLSRNFNFPDERTDTKLESTYTVDITGTANFGLNYLGEHEVSTTSLFLRNTDDETTIRDFFNENREISDEIGFRNFHVLFEERELIVNQVKGRHRFGELTRELPVLSGFDREWIPLDAEVSWFYSDTVVETDIPNQVTVKAQTVTAPTTGEVISSVINADASTSDFRFTLLDDEVLNYGWRFNVPVTTRNWLLEASGGYEHAQKVRTYRQSQFRLGAFSVADPGILEGSIGEVFSDSNITDPANDFVFDLTGTNNQSYLAATMTEAVFGKIDITWKEVWRLSAGGRWEDYKQVALDWNPYGFTITDPVVTTDAERLAQSTFAEDNVYPSVSLTWIAPFWQREWAERFQLRFGWSETVVRPDLREITDASYIDPITDDLVDGNPGVIPSHVANYDIRAECFFANGDNMTLSVFHKDIVDPIEFFESAASDTTVAREIVNATSAEVSGVEVEALKELGFLSGVVGDWIGMFFVQANVTLQDSELVAGDKADAPTHDVRPLAGASEYVANAMLGFDSDDGRHTATLVYNVFGERLYVAGRLGAPDGYEQPYHSLDFTYSWFPTEAITVKAKLRNILDGTVEIEREGVVVFSERPGSSASISFRWAY